MEMPPPSLLDELALTKRVGEVLGRLGLTDHVARLRQHYAALRAGKASTIWSHDLSIEWLRMLRLAPHADDYRVLPRMSDCPGCEEHRQYTTGVFPGGSKHTCGACKATWLELDVCRWVLDRKVARIDSAERDAICVDCGKRALRRPGVDDVLDDYDLTVERFAK
jgi:hypothetical protein